MHNYGARVQVDHRLTMSETPSGHCPIGYRAARDRRASARYPESIVLDGQSSSEGMGR
jgi:hypothetical protein